jgi:hypothetical protein
MGWLIIVMMMHFIIFSLVTIVSICVIKPSNKTQIWLNAIFIPLGTLIFYALICLSIYTPYDAGGKVTESFLLVIISGFVIYFSLKAKFENKITASENIDNEEPATADSYPRNEKSEIDYNKITDPAVYWAALQSEFRGYASVILDDIIAETQNQLKETQAIENVIEKTRATKQTAEKLDFLNKVKAETGKNEKQYNLTLETHTPKKKDETDILFYILVIGVAISAIVAIFLHQKSVRSKGETQRTQYENTAKQSKIVNINYEGLTFSCTDDWEIEKEVLHKNFAFQVNCIKDFYSSVIAITWIRATELTLSEVIGDLIEALKEEPSHKNAEIGSLYNGSFKGQRSLSRDFTISFMGITNYGTITSFIMDGNIVAMLKQSNSKEKLLTEFKTIEESFDVKIPE